MNGNPQSAKLATNKHDIIVGICWLDAPIHRKSWEWEWKWIIDPAQINSRALNMA